MVSRICEANLAALPATVSRPGYDRRRVEGSIVHLGLGAFHRAHEAVYTEAVLAAGDLRWGIVGAGMQRSDMRDALQPQDNLYVLSEVGAGFERLRVIGSLVDVIGGAEESEKARLLDKLSDAGTRIVSLTVTEKGYYLDLASGALQLGNAAIAADLAQPSRPKTILGLIVESLRRRRAAGIAPYTVMSCDNLPNNGKLARAAVLAYAREIDAGLAAWIEAEVSFPCTMVDRITPATTDGDRAAIAAKVGLEDAWPVMTEQFSQWVIEDKFTLGRPDWTLGGAVFSDEIERWEAMKLRCLNGAHSTLAYLGQLSGRETVASAMESALITGALDRLWQENLEVLQAPKGVDVEAYVAQLKRRFCNPALQHKTAQIASDGSQKLPQRLLAPLRERQARGLSSPALALAVAGWMHYVVKVSRAGGTLSDPLSAEILARAGAGGEAAAVVDRLLGLEKIFGTDLPAHAGFRAELVAAFARLAGEPEIRAA